MVSEKEYLLTPLGLFNDGSRQEGEPQTQHVLYSRMKEIVEQQRYLFNSLWDKSTAAEERFKKIEVGVDQTFCRLQP